MPIIAQVGRKNWKVFTIIVLMYLVLAILGVTMVVPFLITLTSSVATPMDYNRFSLTPRALVSREDRFMRGATRYYPETMRFAMDQFMYQFPTAERTWLTWLEVGRNPKLVDKFAKPYLQIPNNPDKWSKAQLMAADYAIFSQSYPINDTICSLNDLHVAKFLRQEYQSRLPANTKGDREAAALQLLIQDWGVPFDSFYTINANRENQTPWDQQNFFPPQDGRAHDFLKFREGYRERLFLPDSMKSKWYQLLRSEEGQQALQEAKLPASTRPFPVTANAPEAEQALWQKYIGYTVPMCESRPYSMYVMWMRYLGQPDQRTTLGLPAGNGLTIAEYNSAFKTQYSSLLEIPFPVTPAEPEKMQKLWRNFAATSFPGRLVTIKTVTPELTAKFIALIKSRVTLERANDLFGKSYNSWDDVVLTPAMPTEDEEFATIWMEFVGGKDKQGNDYIPYEQKTYNCAETAYQSFLLKKYGSIEKINSEYGWNMKGLNQAQMPVDMAYLVTFTKNEGPLFWDSISANYAYVIDYLVLRGRAVFNTVLFILLSLLAALTVNPLAAYALSRFQMKQTAGVILFLLATMAFPGAVSMIPGYLLMRDLHMLNTYWALILPGVANGMSIFMLKGFFDSLPPELYEAAGLDGAKEWQMFMNITIPLSKPILAVIALTTFMGAYNSWEWALIVCQDQRMWTMAVWIYQFNSTMTAIPWAVMASFVIASLPVFLVFLLCQNIIMRGIILPQMK